MSFIKIKMLKLPINLLKFINSTFLKIAEMKFYLKILISLDLNKWMKWIKHLEFMPHFLRILIKELNKIKTCTSKWLLEISQFVYHLPQMNH